MKEAIDATWQLLESIVYEKNDKNLKLKQEKKDDYTNLVESKYKYLMRNFMKENTDYLDRHKVSSIIIISLIESNCLDYENLEDEIFLGRYLIPLNIGLSYMLANINKFREENKLLPLENYVLPKAMTCETGMLEIMARNLYYIEVTESWSFNELDLAEKLFWLESYTILALDNIQLREHLKEK